MRAQWNSRALALGLAGGAALAASVAFPHSAIAAKKTASFTVTAVNNAPGGQVTIVSKVHVTPTQARAEVNHPLQGNFTFLISDGWFYQLDPKKKRGVKKQLPAEFRNRKDNFDFLVAQFGFDPSGALKGAKKLRTETVSGYTCDVLTNSITKGPASRSVTVWMPQKMEPKFAVKAIMADKVTRPGATMNQTITVTLSNVKVSQDVPVSLFKVPTGYNIVSGEPKGPGGK